MPSLTLIAPRDLLRGALLAVAAAALLAAPLAQPTAARTPSCLGKKATIVGTRKADTIRGTRRADVIVAKGGADKVNGRGGADRICGGDGDDTISAGGGNDRVSGGNGGDTIAGAVGDDSLRGDAGDDTILGQDGNDTIDGGLDTDACEQGAGTGAVTNCETTPPPPPPTITSDLSVTVKGPKRATGELTYAIKVHNAGPDPSAYTLRLSKTSKRATCDSPAWLGDTVEAELATDDDRSGDYVITCTKNRKGANVKITARVISVEADPVAANNVFSFTTSLR